MDNEESTIRFPSQFDLVAWGTLVGGAAVVGLVVLGLIFPTPASRADGVSSTATALSHMKQFGPQILVLTILDTIFVCGYLSLFVGLWQLIRDFAEDFARIPLLLGILVAMGDILENALLVVLVRGVAQGWDPHPLVFAMVWTLNFLIDVLSYVTAILFAVFFLTIWKPPSSKFVLGLLLVGYAGVGLTSLVVPSLLLLRSLFFVVGLGFGAHVLFKEEIIPTEELEKLLLHSEQKSDYIR